MEISDKLRDCFDEMVVYKDLKKTNFFSALSLPAFMRDWLLKKFEDDEGNFDKDDLARFVKKDLHFTQQTVKSAKEEHIPCRRRVRRRAKAQPR